ncbi:MAG: hypothetical protein ACRD0F_09530, partial [Acidimicrobiales bacterium]
MRSQPPPFGHSDHRPGALLSVALGAALATVVSAAAVPASPDPRPTEPEAATLRPTEPAGGGRAS